MDRDKPCKERIAGELKDTMQTLSRLWELWKKDPEASDPDYGNWNEYGLGFDYVAPGTFNGQRRGYFRYQICWGGPSEEFRFFCDEGFRLVRVEYWFLDWFDGAKKILSGKNLEILTEIWEDFEGCGSVQNAYNEATQEA